MIGTSLCSALASFDELLDDGSECPDMGVRCVEGGTRSAGSSVSPSMAIRAIATTARSCASLLELGTGRVRCSSGSA